MMKRTIAYLNVATLAETDVTVLRDLSKVFQVHWFVIYEPSKNSSLSINAIKQFAIDHNVSLHIHIRTFRIRSLKNWTFYKRLYDDMMRIMPDLIYHCNTEFYWAFFFLRRNKKIVMGLHDVVPHSSRKGVASKIRALSNIFVRKVFANNIVFSKNQKELYEKIYGREVVNVGMSCKDFGIPTVQTPDITNGIRFLFFGSISHYKGLDLLINAIENLHADGIDNIFLTIAGKGNDKEWENIYMPLIKTTEIYNIQYRYVDSDEIPNLVTSHHFLVLPYRDATQSGPVLISANYCMPIIAPAFGCFRDTYDNSSAILYPVGQLKDALLKASSLTQEQYAAIKRNCVKVREENSENKVAQNYIDYFNKVLEE